MVAQNFLYFLFVLYSHLAFYNSFALCSVLDKFGNLNDVKILPKKYVIDVTQDKPRSNTVNIQHNIPIDGTYNISQTKPSKSRVSIALNAARGRIGCKINVEIIEADDCSLEINLNSAENSDVDVVMNKAKNSKLILTFSSSEKTAVKLYMDSPKGTSVDIRQDYGFDSPIVARITNALDSKISINQINPKASPLDVCIQEGNNKNVININQIQPTESQLTRGSTSCSTNTNTDSVSNTNPDVPISNEPANNESTNEATTQTPSVSSFKPSITTLKSSTPDANDVTTLDTDYETGPGDDYHSETAVFFDNSEGSQSTENEQNSNLLVDIGEDEDYYYYYDFNNDDTLNVEDFPDYEDYQIGTRHKNKGKCIRVQKTKAKGKDWERKIGPLWRSLAQQIGVRRCKTTKNAQDSSDAIRFGV